MKRVTRGQILEFIKEVKKILKTKLGTFKKNIHAKKIFAS